MANYIGNQPSKGEFRKIDQFVFDGSTTVFNLISNTIPFVVGSATQLTISINGVLQEPGVAYTVVNGGTQISFTTAPVTGTPFFGTALSGAGDVASYGDTLTLTGDIIASSFIGDGSALTGIVTDLTPYATIAHVASELIPYATISHVACCTS